MKKIYALALLSSLLIVSCKKEAETTPILKKNVVPFTEVGNQMKNEAAIANQPQQKVLTNSVPNTAPVQKGMNPAHGQPGHRCDIPVGAPLKSTPAPSTPTPRPQTVTAPVNTVTTVTKPAENTVTPEGMNPPHGQENHRCDIAVGAPLPKQ
ncbi:hypothetical protein DNC80_00440 [Flavobacterium sp. SOK18b]|uniref:hypothetical protein n=1 Tax=Flavobacterium sp. SOK18b TaxID=797900 RepID=UPI0015FB50A6|nr:hypothetical protein [Flavobacterium sp. SOK18b]MBB1192139.1 hypothetical protein [Flavobacterium sp. SOK18b]